LLSIVYVFGYLFGVSKVAMELFQELFKLVSKALGVVNKSCMRWD
jgi:hypothetical protein